MILVNTYMGDCPSGIASKVWYVTMPSCAALHIYTDGTWLSKKIKECVDHLNMPNYHTSTYHIWLCEMSKCVALKADRVRHCPTLDGRLVWSPVSWLQRRWLLLSVKEWQRKELGLSQNELVTVKCHWYLLSGQSPVHVSHNGNISWGAILNSELIIKKNTWLAECFLVWSNIYPWFMDKVSTLINFPLELSCEVYSFLGLDASFDKSETITSSLSSGFLHWVVPFLTIINYSLLLALRVINYSAILGHYCYL